jgi:ABC-type uncharacterized transport system substrate-binding protein
MEELEIWRLITDKTASLYELETTWSLDDAMRANAVLDMKQAIEAKAMKGLSKGTK